MPQIPLVQRSVTPSTQPVGAQMSPSAAAAPYDALARLGGEVSGFTDTLMAIKEKKDKLRLQAENADYEVRAKALKNKIEVAKKEALLSGKSYMNLQEEVVSPLISQFELDTLSKQYSEQTLKSISPKWQIAKDDIVTSTELQKINLETEDYVVRNREYANDLYLSGDKEKADEVFDSLSGIVGPARVDEMKSLARYNFVTESVSQAELALQRGEITAQQYVDKLNESASNLDDENINANHQSQLKSMIQYKQANAFSAMAKEAQAFEKDLKKAVADGNLDPTWTERARVIYGEETMKNMGRILSNTLNSVGATNKDVKKLMSMVNELPNSPMTYGKIVEEAAASGGEYGEEVRELAAIIAAEHIKSNASLAYEKSVTVHNKYMPFGPAVTSETRVAPYTGWVAGVHKKVVDVMNLVPSNKDFNKKYQNLSRKLIDFYYTNENPTKEELSEFTMELLGEDISNVVSGTRTPTIQQPAEGEKAGGTEYTHPSGRKYIRYQDGSIEWQ